MSWLHPKGHTLPGAPARAVGQLLDRPHPYPGPSVAPRGDHEGGACPPLSSPFPATAIPSPQENLPLFLSQRPISCLHSNQITAEGAGSEPTGRHTGPRTLGTFSASGPGRMVKGSLVPKDCQQSPGNREESGCASCQAQPQYPPYTGSNTDRYLQPSRTPDGRQPQEAWALGPTQALSDVEQLALASPVLLPRPAERPQLGTHTSPLQGWIHSS